MAEGGPLLVTGAGGFVGMHLCDRAGARGLEVVPVGRSDGHRQIDIRDVDAVASLLTETNPTAVIHLAGARPGRAGSWDGLVESLHGIGSVIDAVGRVGIDAPVLIPGSAAQYGMAGPGRLTEESPTVPVTPYGAAKCVCETACLSEPLRGDVRVIWTRSFNHLGPGQSRSTPVADWAAQVAAAEHAGEGVMRTGNLDRVRDFLDVRDVADAYLDLVASDAAGVVNVCSGEATRLADVAHRLVSLSRVDIRIEEDEALVRRRDPPRVVGDPARLHELTGFKPKYDVARSLEDALDEWRTVIATRPKPMNGAH